jgi:hypothetical protein
MVESGFEYLNIRTPDEEAYAECWVVEDTAGLDAQCYLFGPKRGDEIFGLVKETLQATANKNKLPLRHIYTSSNKGSLALVERNDGYTPVGRDKLGNDLFERVFTPQSTQEEVK